MRTLSLSLSVLLLLAWTAHARQDPEKPRRRVSELRAGIVDVDARGDGDKWTRVRFDPELDAPPVVTATVCDMKAPGEHPGVFAVITKDVDESGFRFKVQEAGATLQWSEKLRLHWIAVVQEER